MNFFSILFSEFKAHFQPQKVYTVFYNVPQLARDFYPLWWAKTPMMQSIVAKYFNVPDIKWKQVYLSFHDNVKCRLDYVEPPIPFKGVILLFHGLGGSSDSSYCRILANDFGNEYKIIVYNRRAHVPDSQSPNVPTHYDKADLECVLDYTSQVAKGRPIYGVGFSCGANLLMRYVGESGSSCIFKKVLSCGNGWDYNHATSNVRIPYMENVLCKFANEIYANVPGAKLNSPKTLSCGNGWDINHVVSNIIQPFSENIVYNFASKMYANVAGVKLNSPKSFREQEMQLHNYEREEQLVAYYNNISAIEFIKNIRIPALCMDSYDDPIYWYHDMDSIIDINPNLSFIFTSHGGHVSWVESVWPGRKDYYSRVLKAVI